MHFSERATFPIVMHLTTPQFTTQESTGQAEKYFKQFYFGEEPVENTFPPAL